MAINLFWTATLILLISYAVIASEKVHKTKVALMPLIATFPTTEFLRRNHNLL